MNTVVETFVDAFGEISFKHGMIRIELLSLSSSDPQVTMRLITSLQAFSQMLRAQNSMIARLEEARVIRPVEAERVTEVTAEPGSASTLQQMANPPTQGNERSPQATGALPAPPRSPNFSEQTE